MDDIPGGYVTGEIGDDHMTDADLAEALGWRPCEWHQYESDGLWWECTTHIISGWRHRPEVCSVAAERLESARAGISLAKAGIAHAIEQKWAAVAREWQP